jgi:hypothetical protein
MTPAPIKYAQEIGKRHEAQRVVILMVDARGTHSWTSWGETRADCRALKQLDDKRGDEWLAEMFDVREG